MQLRFDLNPVVNLRQVLATSAYYLGLYEFFMIVEDTIQRWLNICQEFPPPIVALHLHLPHTLYCLARQQADPFHPPFAQGNWLPRIGVSFDVWGLESIILGLQPVPIILSYLLGLLNLILAGWAFIRMLSNRTEMMIQLRKDRRMGMRAGTLAPSISLVASGLHPTGFPTTSQYIVSDEFGAPVVRAEACEIWSSRNWHGWKRYRLEACAVGTRSPDGLSNCEQ